jgi:hypothetical protein
MTFKFLQSIAQSLGPATRPDFPTLQVDTALQSRRSHTCHACLCGTTSAFYIAVSHDNAKRSTCSESGGLSGRYIAARGASRRNHG